MRLGFVNVGDSRIYRFAEDELRQVSDDHSLVGTMLRAGQLTADEAASHPQRNIVTRALGISDRRRGRLLGAPRSVGREVPPV